MNRVLIISDSHGWEDELSIIRKRHKDIEEVVHCGDSELQGNNNSLAGYRVVKGNCDRDGELSNEILFEHGGLTFLVVHGHLFDVKTSLMKLEYRAQETNADVVCFGHSHVAYAEEINNRLLINPGSIRLPRYFNEGSYAILSWEHLACLQLEFYTVNGNKIAGFPYSTQFNLKRS